MSKKFFVKPAVNEGFLITEHNNKVGALFTEGAMQCVGIAIEGVIERKVHTYTTYEKAIYLVHILGVVTSVVDEKIKIKVEDFINRSIHKFSPKGSIKINIISPHQQDEDNPSATMLKFICNHILSIINELRTRNFPSITVDKVDKSSFGLYIENGEVIHFSNRSEIANKFTETKSSTYVIDFRIAMLDKEDGTFAKLDNPDRQIVISEYFDHKYIIDIRTYENNADFVNRFCHNHQMGIFNFLFKKTVLNLEKNIYYNYNLMEELQKAQESLGAIEFDVEYKDPTAFNNKGGKTFYNIFDLKQFVENKGIEKIDLIEGTIDFEESIDELINREFNFLGLYYSVSENLGISESKSPLMKVSYIENEQTKHFVMNIEGNNITLIELEKE